LLSHMQPPWLWEKSELDESLLQTDGVPRASS
jgi:hypothetical protein